MSLTCMLWLWLKRGVGLHLGSLRLVIVTAVKIVRGLNSGFRPLREAVSVSVYERYFASLTCTVYIWRCLEAKLVMYVSRFALNSCRWFYGSCWKLSSMLTQVSCTSTTR